METTTPTTLRHVHVFGHPRSGCHCLMAALYQTWGAGMNLCRDAKVPRAKRLSASDPVWPHDRFLIGPSKQHIRIPWLRLFGGHGALRTSNPASNPQVPDKIVLIVRGAEATLRSLWVLNGAQNPGTWTHEEEQAVLRRWLLSSLRSWVEHSASWSRARDRIHIVRYEELVRKPVDVLTQLGKDLGLPPPEKEPALPQERVSWMRPEEAGILAHFRWPESADWPAVLDIVTQGALMSLGVASPYVMIAGER